MGIDVMCSFKTDKGRCSNPRGPGQWKAAYDEIERLINAVDDILDNVRVNNPVLGSLEGASNRAKKLVAVDWIRQYHRRCPSADNSQCSSFGSLFQAKEEMFQRMWPQCVLAINNYLASGKVGTYTENQKKKFLSTAEDNLKVLFDQLGGWKDEINARLVRSECMYGLEEITVNE